MYTVSGLESRMTLVAARYVVRWAGCMTSAQGMLLGCEPWEQALPIAGDQLGLDKVLEFVKRRQVQPLCGMTCPGRTIEYFPRVYGLSSLLLRDPRALKTSVGRLWCTQLL